MLVARSDKCSHEVTPHRADLPRGPSAGGLDRRRAGTGMRATPHVLYCSDDKHLYRYDFETQELDHRRRHHAAGVARGLRAAAVAHEQHAHPLGDGEADRGRRRVAVHRNDRSYDENTVSALAVVSQDSARSTRSQIDRTGTWLLIKENLDGQDDEDNRIISLVNERRAHHHRSRRRGRATPTTATAIWSPPITGQPEATWRVWRFGEERPGRRRACTTPWDAQVIHVSHCNARPGAPAESQWVLGSGTIERPHRRFRWTARRRCARGADARDGRDSHERRSATVRCDLSHRRTV